LRSAAAMELLDGFCPSFLKTNPVLADGVYGALTMIVRRIGEYAFVRPGREMLFAPLDAESKYKAKNVIDTVVYRAGDAVSGWGKTALDMFGQGAGLVAVDGVICALLWGYLGWQLGKQADGQTEVRVGAVVGSGA
ncbi:Npt1/Npt2 family nucleotide transporter, partial [Stutzerimonas stutzeri]